MSNILFDKKNYPLQALFRACSEIGIANRVVISEDESSYVIQNINMESIDCSEIIEEVNLQVIKIALESKFYNIRNMIVEKALSVNIHE